MQKYLYFSVFVSGMASLALEMASSRLLENHFGTSNLIWASIIGLILIYLTFGYFIGGYWADRKASYSTFFLILTGAACSIALVPIISAPILTIASDAFDKLQMGPLFGSFSSVLVLLLVPVTLLGTASPFAIRLAIKDSTKIGSTSGQVYAISTLGSFIGTFLPGLFLIPLIGTFKTFEVIAFLLFVTALMGLWFSNKQKLALFCLPVLLVVCTLLWFFWPDALKHTKGQIYETESSYNYIQVLQENQYTMLRLNEGQGVHSVYHPTVNNFYGPWEQVLVAPFFNPAPFGPEKINRIAIVGLAAGTTARQASQVYGPVNIDGYEIDPKIVEVAQKYFDMNMPNLNVYIQDGRWGLSHSPYKYDIISIDAYRPPYIPWHLTTQEFFKIVREHLTENGVMTLNIGRAPQDRRLIEILSSTALTSFSSVHVMDIPNSYNSIVFLTVQPTTVDNFLKNYQYLANRGDINPLLLETAAVTAANIQPSPQPGQVFTDDHAPIEWMTNNLVLNFLFSTN
jgi:spermidine synthase